MIETIIMQLLALGEGLGNTLIAIALVYLALEVRGLRKVIDKLLPKVDEHGDRISDLEGWRDAQKARMR